MVTNNQLPNGYANGRGVKNAIKCPKFFMYIRGRFFDAKKGIGVSDARIAGFMNSSSGIENEECLKNESYLKPMRDKGENALGMISVLSGKLSDLPKAVEVVHDWDILENARRANEAANTNKSIESARIQLYTINENLINGSVILDQRIAKIRKKTSGKIDAYIAGLRAGGLSDYNPEIVFTDEAAESYYNRNLNLDHGIAEFAKIPVQAEEAV